jgi:hypothetical protein
MGLIKFFLYCGFFVCFKLFLFVLFVAIKWGFVDKLGVWGVSRNCGFFRDILGDL